MKRKVLFAFWPLAVEWNHGIALLSSICKQAGIDTDLSVLGDMGDFVAKLWAAQPDYVAFSMVTQHEYPHCKPFMEMAQSMGFTVLAGGVFLRRFCPPDIPADFVCRGEGETLPEFILGGDKALFTERQMYQGSLDDLPLPDYELFNGHPYKREISLFEDRKVIPFNTSRGCPYSCTFCEVATQPKNIRIRQDFVKDLDYLAKKYHPDVFHIGDELTPYYNKGWMHEMQKNTHQFISYVHAGIPAEKLEALIDVGMVGCAFGVESIDQDFRNKVFKKGLSEKRLDDAIEVLQRRGIDYIHFYLTGFPGQKETVEQTQAFAQRLGGQHVIWNYEQLHVN